MTTGISNPESSGAAAVADAPTRGNEWKSPFGPGRDELLAAIATREGTAPELREVVFRGKRVAFAGIESSATTDLAEVFVSMANTNGGLVVLGVRERDRAIVGVAPERRKTLERFIVNIATARCDPQVVPEVFWRRLPDAAGAERLCLVIYIEPSFRRFHCTADGRYLRRSEGRRFLMPAHLLEPVLKRQRPPRPPIEDRPAPQAPLSALDRTLLDAYFRRRALPQPAAPETRLRSHRFAAETDGGTAPTLLGLLIFCRRPDEHWPGAFLEIESYASDERDSEPKDTRRVTGPLPQQVNDAVSFFAESLSRATDRSNGGSDAPAWSLPALQEAMVNAVIHRDYSIPAPVVVRRFPTRIEIESPGSLFRDQSPDDLYAGAPFQQRNQMIAGILYHFDSRVTGRPLAKSGTEPGFLPLMRECERRSGRRPTVEEPGDATRLTIYAATATDAETAEEPTRRPEERP